MIKSIEENSKSWILSKYSRYNAEDSSWNTLDSSNCISPITLKLTPSCHLVINYNTEIQECINLWNSKENHQGVVKGSSLLITHRNRDFYGKFRVKFLPFDNRSAEENCFTCINVLKQYFKINEMESQTINNSIIDSQLSTSSNRKVNSSVNIDSQLEGLSLNNKDTFTHQDMALALLKKTENILPLFVQSENNQEGNDEKILKEFILCNLFDQSFPNFVEKVEKILNQVVLNEIVSQ